MLFHELLYTVTILSPRDTVRGRRMETAKKDDCDEKDAMWCVAVVDGVADLHDRVP